MNGIYVFLWGLGGSLAVELLDLYDIFPQRAPQVARERRIVIPAKYRSTVYWSVRVALAVVGGMLAVAYGVTTPLLALNVGATAGLVIRNLASRPPSHPEPLLDTAAQNTRN